MANPSTSATPKPSHRLLSAARLLEAVQPGKFVLPLSSWDKILPGKIAFVPSKPQIDHLLADRLLVADPQKWRISAFRASPRIGGWQVRGDHPALSDPGPESSTRLPPFPVDDGVELSVEYVGPEASGAHFVACLCAERVANQSHDRLTLRGQEDLEPQMAAMVQRMQAAAAGGTAAVTLLAESPPVSPGEQVCLTLPARAHDLHVSSLTLRVAEPSHWLVSDILIGGDTLLVASGNLPGELLADRPERTPLRLGRLHVREDLVIQATYIGPLPSASLAYEVSGSEVPTSDAAADSAFLPMSTDVLISDASHGWSSVQVSGWASVPQGYAFLPEEVVLHDPEKWVVSEVKVGNMLQFACSGDVPGAIFGARTRGCHLNFSAVLEGIVPLVLTVKYIGPNTTTGEPFICGVVGRVVRLPDAGPSRM